MKKQKDFENFKNVFVSNEIKFDDALLVKFELFICLNYHLVKELKTYKLKEKNLNNLELKTKIDWFKFYTEIFNIDSNEIEIFKNNIEENIKNTNENISDVLNNLVFENVNNFKQITNKLILFGILNYSRYKTPNLISLFRIL